MPVKSVTIPTVKKTQVSNPIKQIKNQTSTNTETSNKQEYVGFPSESARAYTKLFKMTPEQIFDFKLHSGTKMKNGATLIRPIMLSLGETIIKPTDNGQYSIIAPISTQSLTMTEDELKNTKWLSRGTIKQMEDDKFFLDYTDKDGKTHFVEATKEEAMKILNDNRYYM